MFRSPALIAASPFALTLAFAPAAWGASVAGNGSAALSVEDILDSDEAVFTVPGPGADSFQLATGDGAFAGLDYSFDQTGLDTTLAVDAHAGSGDALGTGFVGFAFTFTTTAETVFEFSVESDDEFGVPMDFRAVFADVAVEAFADPDAPNGIAGNLPLHGPFFATGVLPPGVYTLTIDLFQSFIRGTPTDGGVDALVKLSAAHAPTPTAASLGILTIAAAGLAATRRRRTLKRP